MAPTWLNTFLSIVSSWLAAGPGAGRDDVHLTEAFSCSLISFVTCPFTSFGTAIDSW
jgi:hypothetical protein